MTVSSMAGSDLRIAGVEPESAVDGPGVCFTVFLQGCLHRCPGCHNPETWDPEGGTTVSVGRLLEMIDDEEGLIGGVTVSGGEPLLQAAAVADMLRACKCRALRTTMFTGYVYEDVADRDDLRAVWDHLDLLVDGPFVKALHSAELTFRGSSNQRLIDVRATRRTHSVVPWRP